MERKETNKRKKDALLNKRKINNTVYPITGTFQNCGLQQERKLQTVDGLTAVHWRKHKHFLMVAAITDIRVARSSAESTGPSLYIRLFIRPHKKMSRHDKSGEIAGQLY